MVIPFVPEHLRQLDVQPAQLDWYEAAVPGMEHAWTAVTDRPIACGGVIELWPQRGYLWALLDRNVGPHMLALTRVIRSRLDGLGYRRLEMTVDASFSAAVRWARMLGFECETPVPMRAFTPAGHACYLFSRVRPCG
jgi:hypothetical protein